MEIIRNFLILLIGFFLVGCAQFSGGGDYRYTHYDSLTKETTRASVHSVREIESALIIFKPDGTAIVQIEGIKPGPDNLGKALDIIKVGLTPKVAQ